MRTPARNKGWALEDETKGMVVIPLLSTISRQIGHLLMRVTIEAVFHPPPKPAQLKRSVKGDLGLGGARDLLYSLLYRADSTHYVTKMKGAPAMCASGLWGNLCSSKTIAWIWAM